MRTPKVETLNIFTAAEEQVLVKSMVYDMELAVIVVVMLLPVVLLVPQLVHIAIILLPYIELVMLVPLVIEVQV